MFVIGMVFAHFVALRLYKAALITDIFLVQEKSAAEAEDESKSGSKRNEEMRDLYEKAKQTIQFDGLMDRQSTIGLVEVIIRRKRLIITLKHILLDFILGFCQCRRKPKFLVLDQKSNERLRIFQQAQKMLNKQFDVTKLLKMVNLTQILLSALLTREEQFLLLF